jgi:hypothetical protein
MANDFKRFAKPDVGTGTGASADEVYSVPAGAGSTALESIIIGIAICNKTALEKEVGIFLDNYDGTNDVYITKTLKVPAYSTVEIMQGNKLVVQNNGTAGDVVRAECNTGSSVDVTVSVLEDV